MQIIAIGGGDLREKETLGIDRYVVEATGKERPNALFLPTASEDSPEYWEAFQETYARELGCPCRELFLVREQLSSEQIEEAIDWADLIYVGGGNTRKMLIRWRKLGVDKLLRETADKGTILSGLSAGANCWFRHANSDAPMMEGRTDILTMRLDCLAFVDATLCPHMKQEEFRPSEFKNMMRTTPGVGLGVDDHCALHIKNDTYRVVACRSESYLHRMWWEAGTFHHEKIEPHEDFRPMEDLLNQAVNKN